MRTVERDDEARFRELVREFHPRLLRYLRARDPVHADDIAKSTWVEVAAWLEELDAGAGELGWRLFATAAQRLIECGATHPVSCADQSIHVVGNRNRTSDHVNALDDVDGQGAVDWIVAILDQDQSEVVLLRALGGLSDAAIGAVMQRPTAWVESTSDHALRTLRVALDPR